MKVFFKKSSNTLFLNLISFTVLVITGRLSLELSSLDGYSTPVWPPAGIALALILIFGNRVGFGIFFGSFIINSRDLNLDSNLISYFITHSQNLVIAFGSSLQAIFSSYLVRRFAFYPHLFYSPKEILLFFIFSGPISCLISSSIGAFTLFTYSLVQAEFMFQTWLIWWMGDSIGVIIFTPLILFIWNGINKKERIIRVILVTSGMVITLLSAGLIFFITRNWEAKALELRIKTDGHAISHTIEQILMEAIRSTKILGNYIQLTKDLDRNKFEAFSRNLIEQNDGLLAMYYSPLISDSQRTVAEKELNSEYPDHFWLMEKDSEGNLVKASIDKEYSYIKYIYPYKDNENALGYNVLSNTVRRVAVQKSIRSSNPQLTGRIRLVEENGNLYGLVLLSPIFVKDKIIGFSTSLFRMQTILEKAIQSNVQEKLCIKIEDDLEEIDEKFLVESDCAKINENLSHKMKYQTSIAATSRTWNISIIPSDEYIQVYLNKSSSFILVIVGFLTGILGMLILIITGRENSIQVKVEERTRELEKANRIKTEFLANMSHEIRTPMNGVLGMLQLLEDTPLNGDQRNFTDNAKKSTESLLSIINDILDVSKIEKNKLELNPHPFNLYNLVNNVINMFLTEVHKKGILLNLDYLIYESDSYIFADENRIRQILINVIGNAIKFTQEGRIEVKVSLVESKENKNLQDIQFEISDTGIGISEENIQRLFNQFVQVEDFKIKKFQGSGLGLYISKQLVDLMEGSILLNSEIEKGTTFFIKIPFLKAAPDQAQVIQNIQEVVEKNIPFRQLKLLLAEDNEINQMYIDRILKNMGHSLDIAFNGKEAIAFLMAKGNLYDLILMDIQMPEMDGLTACKLIRESIGDYKDIPIIAFTANAMDSQIKEYFEVGMNEFLAKPINADSLFSGIATTLNINKESIYKKNS